MNQHFIHSLTISGILILSLGLFSMVTAQPAEQIEDTQNQTLNLEQAIKISLANNTQIKRSLLAIQDADQQVRNAWSNVMPDVSASVNYTRNLEKPVFFFPVDFQDPNSPMQPISIGEDNDWQGGLNVSQTIFSGQAFVGISSSELYKAAQSESMRATAQGIVTQTRITYYQALVAKEQLRLTRVQIDRITENLEDIRKQYEQGFTDEYAVIQLEVQISNLEPQLTRAQFSVENALKDLLDVMGLPVQLSIDVKGDLSGYNIHTKNPEDDANTELKKINGLTPLALEEDSATLEQAMELRGDLRSLGIQKQLQNKQLDAQRSTFLPNIVANYGLNWTAQQPGSPEFFGTEDNRARSQTFSVGIQLPIFQGFSRNVAVQQAKIQIKDTELQQYQAKQAANKEIFEAKQGVREAMQTSDALIKALEQAERGYERALVRYQNGVSSQQEVTDAELQLREAESNYAQMVSGYLTAKAQYDLAIGQVPFVHQDIQEIKENIQLK